MQTPSTWLYPHALIQNDKEVKLPSKTASHLYHAPPPILVTLLKPHLFFSHCIFLLINLLFTIFLLLFYLSHHLTYKKLVHI